MKFNNSYVVCWFPVLRWVSRNVVTLDVLGRNSWFVFVVMFLLVFVVMFLFVLMLMFYLMLMFMLYFMLYIMFMFVFFFVLVLVLGDVMIMLMIMFFVFMMNSDALRRICVLCGLAGSDNND